MKVINEKMLLVRNGAHIGTQRKVEYMRRFIFRIRPDGLSIINADMTLDRIKDAAKLLSHYEPEDILVAASREQAAQPVKAFAEVTGVKYVTGRFYPGTLTNPNLDTFMEPKILVVVDPYLDRQAIAEAFKVGIPVISLASTNNTPTNVDLIIPCNNKSRRSLAAVFYLLANWFLRYKGALKENEFIKERLEYFIGVLGNR